MSIHGKEVILSETESLCPVCMKKIKAERVAIDGDVYLDKRCSNHGRFRVVIWRGQPSYQSWSVPKIPSHPVVTNTQVRQGCPYDCGLCPEHRQHTCCVLLEVTQRCNLTCPVCFAEAGGECGDPDIGVIEGWYHMLLKSGGPYNIQLSGGEPTLRDDLPEIITMGKSLGFDYIQLNTNGIRIAQELEYAERLKRAGLSCVFLQFDGTNDTIYERLRGARLLATKKSAIDQCTEQKLGVVLVPTLVPGVNTEDIGNIIKFAVDRMPTIRGVHFQPISYFGRFLKEPSDADRITIPEVIKKIEEQTGGRMQSASFLPPGGENAYCSFHGNFELMANGELKSWKKADKTSCCTPQMAAVGAKKAQAFVAKRWVAPKEKSSCCDTNADSLEAFLERVNQYSLCISGMAFQDVWNVDLERLRDCFIHVVSPDSRIIPFCAYNLTDKAGNHLYRS